VPVTGIELSRPMIGQLRTKADKATIWDCTEFTAESRSHVSVYRIPPGQ